MKIAAAAPFAGSALSAFAAAGGPWPVGCQSYSFRTFDLAGAIAQLQALGLNEMEFFSGHIAPDIAHPEFEERKAIIDASGITVPCFGVEGFGNNEETNRQRFEFAKALGIGIITANPAPNSFDNLEALVAEYDIKIAIHNHGPRARYDKVQDTLDAVAGKDARIGACLDTGHCIRSGEKPHEAAKALGDRLHSLHLKDWTYGGAEQIPGEGDMDLEALAAALREVGFNGPIMLEYEESPDDPVPDMRIGLANWRKAAGAQGDQA